MTKKEKLKSALISWNVNFPLDREFRRKHNIAFGSEEHRRINQIDIYFEYLEGELYRDIEEDIKKEIEGKKQYEKGDWLKDQELPANVDENDLFDSIDVLNFNAADDEQ